MAKIGTIPLTLNGNIDSGLAQLLVKPPREYHELSHAGARLILSPDNAFAVCLFNNAKSHIETIRMGSPILQECLDLLSMTGTEDTSTRDSSDEYIAWWSDGGVKSLSYNVTATSTLRVNHPSITILDAEGKIVPQENITPGYHEAFRFFRLAQISDDLFDSYRNMYLAFEFLLSSKYPKNNEHETVWFKNSLTCAQQILQLNRFVPVGTSSSVDFIFKTIYENARLPLFHAKDGKMKFVPTDFVDRKVVSEALSILTNIVIQMADVWYNCHRLSGGFNLKYMEEVSKTALLNSQIVFSDNPKFSIDDHLDNESLKKGYRSSASYNDQFLGEDSPNVSGQIAVSEIKDRDQLRALFVVNEKSVQMACSLESPVDLEGFHRFETTFLIRRINGNQPKSFFSR